MDLSARPKASLGPQRLSIAHARLAPTAFYGHVRPAVETARHMKTSPHGRLAVTSVAV